MDFKVRKDWKDLTGQKFGLLKVISFSHRKSFSRRGYHYYWNCVCECGGSCTPTSNALRAGHSTSCGCLLKLSNKKNKEISLTEQRARTLRFNNYKNQAKERGYNWELSKEFCYEIFKKDCHYCGEPPSNRLKAKNSIFIYNGIDRVDNTIGYKEDNVVPCCAFCNWSKNNYTLQEFLSWVKKVHESMEIRKNA